MQHFFVEPSQVQDGRIYITGGDVNHMKNVLRMKIGEQAEINDGQGSKYLGEILELNQDEVVLEIIETMTCDTELPCKIHLYQGLPKGDKMELIVEKSVELGVARVIPVETKRAIVKLDAKKKGKKVEKWNSVSKAAAKQSARGVIPFVDDVATFKQAMVEASSLGHVLVPYELAEGMGDTQAALADISIGDDISLFIGPEGGFDVSEIELAISMGAKPISLGKRILRTETAGITALSILMYHMETTLVAK